MRGSREERPISPRQLTLWANALVLVVLAAGIGCLALIGLALPGGAAWGFDFDAYYRASLRLLETGTPYSPDTLAGPFRLGPAGLYLYSPLPAVLLVPLAWLDQASATQVWFVARVALFGLTCVLIPASWRVRALTFGLAAVSMPVVRDLVLGNVSLIVTFLSVLAWRFLDRPAAGVAIGVSLFIRPMMGLVVAWWLVRRRWAPLAAAAATAGLLAVLSAAMIGIGPYLDYVRLLGNLVGATGVPQNLDLSSLAANAGAPPVLVQAALLASLAVAVMVPLLSLRRDREASFVVTSVAVLFASPLLWDHYLTQLLIVAAFMASRGRWWGLLLLPLTWLPPVLMPLLTLVAMALPFLVPRAGEPALAPLRGWGRGYRS